jgi:hypothetical protein
MLDLFPFANYFSGCQCHDPKAFSMFTYREGHIYTKTRGEDVLCIPEVKLGEYALREHLFKLLSNYDGKCGRLSQATNSRSTNRTKSV